MGQQLRGRSAALPSVEDLYAELDAHALAVPYCLDAAVDAAGLSEPLSP